MVLFIKKFISILNFLYLLLYFSFHSLFILKLPHKNILIITFKNVIFIGKSDLLLADLLKAIK